MRKTQVTVYLDADETERLDARAAKLRLSRSAYVSRIIAADLAATVSDVAEQMIRLERDLSRTALAMQAMLESQGPELVREVAERMDARVGPGAHARLIRELREETGVGETGVERGIHGGAGAAPGPDRGEEGGDPQ